MNVCWIWLSLHIWKLYNLESYSEKQECICVMNKISLKSSKGLYIGFHLEGLRYKYFEMNVSELQLRFLRVIKISLSDDPERQDLGSTLIKAAVLALNTGLVWELKVEKIL